MIRSAFADDISFVFGWSYCLAWSLSFYPQVILNYQRKCVKGLSVDYQMLNMMGYTFYSIFTCTLKWNKTILEQYSDVFSDNLVTIQDVVFATHGALLTAITIYQCYIYQNHGSEKLTPFIVKAVVIVCSLNILYLFGVLIGGGNGGPVVFHRDGEPNVKIFSWLCWIYALSIVKLGVTTFKNIPQVVLNYQRKSTVGWSIRQVILDWVGGVLSTSQILLDGATVGWEGVVGNPIKLGLGLVSVFYDIIYMIQHFILYTDRGDEAVEFYKHESDKYGKYQSTDNRDLDVEKQKEAARIVL
jgi:cystinosin